LIIVYTLLYYTSAAGNGCYLHGYDD